MINQRKPIMTKTHSAVAISISVATIIAAGLFAVRHCCAEVVTPPEASAQAAKKASAEYSKGWCAAWAGAVALEQQRYGNWLATVQVGRPDARTDQERVVDVMAKGVTVYVMLGPVAGDITLGDGTVVHCDAPAPPPAVTPVAPAAPTPPTPKGPAPKGKPK